MKLFSSLKLGCLLAILLSATLFFFGLIQDMKYHHQLAQDSVNTNALRLAQYVASDQYKYLELSEQLLRMLAQQTSGNTFTDPSCAGRLQEELKRHPYLANLGIIDGEGYLLCSARPEKPGMWLGDRNYYIDAKKTKGFAVGDPQTGRITKSSTINVAYPVIAENGAVTAVVYGALDLTWLSANIIDHALDQDIGIVLLDQNGTLLAHHSTREAPPTLDKKTLQYIGQQKIAGWISSVDNKDDVRLYAYTPFLEDWGKNLYLAVVSPLEPPLGQYLGRYTSLMIVALFLIAALLWLFFRRWVLIPLRAVAGYSRQLSQHDYSARVDLQPTLPELTELVTSMECLATELQRLQSTDNEHNSELKRTHRALQTLSSGNHVLLRAENEKILLQKMCDIAVNTAGYMLAWVGYAEDNSQKTVSIQASAGGETNLQRILAITWDTSDKGYGPTGTAIRTGKSVHARGLQTAAQYQHWHGINRQLGVHSAISLPLTIDRKVFGAFTILSEDPEAFLENECHILEEMASDLAFGIKVLRTNEKQLESERLLHEMANYDSLTKLPNYTQFRGWLADRTDSSASNHKPFAILLFGLNRLREINGTLGYEAGNWVLRETGKRLREALAERGSLARLHGDEFGIILDDTTPSHIEKIVQTLHSALNELYRIDNYTLTVKGTFGIAFFPQHGLTPEKLMGMADKALQKAKDSGNLYEISEPDNEMERKRLLSLAAKLHSLLKNDKLQVYYQPKVDFRSGRVTGFEALARWWDSAEGMIAPDTFVGLAEKTGMIRELSIRVFEEVLRQLSLWQQQGIYLPVAVNLSARSLHDSKLLNLIDQLLDRWSIPPEMLEIEITETAIMEDKDIAYSALSKLREKGIKIYVDDYGTGFSSLSILKKQPIHALKIDKSFVIDMLVDTESAIIVGSTIRLAHELELSVVAEGVESEAVWARLSELDCDVGQGYYMGKPMPVEDVNAWLKQSPWGIGSSGIKGW
ncbi:bifunctional diguanylate cyclase/phosphodiesterase [Porticoccus sp.]